MPFHSTGLARRDTGFMRHPSKRKVEQKIIRAHAAPIGRTRELAMGRLSEWRLSLPHPLSCRQDVLKGARVIHFVEISLRALSSSPDI